jgi:hypothetical protein
VDIDSTKVDIQAPQRTKVDIQAELKNIDVRNNVRYNIRDFKKKHKRMQTKNRANERKRKIA